MRLEAAPLTSSFCLNVFINKVFAVDESDIDIYLTIYGYVRQSLYTESSRGDLLISTDTLLVQAFGIGLFLLAHPLCFTYSETILEDH